jgi:2-isopropylmalate synthase
MVSGVDMRTVYFSDTTLRDGEQMPGASLNIEQKVRIARSVVEAGVASLDAGFPACAQTEIAAIQRITSELPATSVSALARTLPQDIDKAFEALANSRPDKRSVSLFIGTSPLHRTHKLRLSVGELIRVVRESIEYARQKFPLVAFSPEDASRTEPEVLCQVYTEAIDAGARVIGFPDTVGVLMPKTVRTMLKMIQDNVPNFDKSIVAGHFHNDLGLATANALAALEEGVPILQCTVNGIGERAGNTAFEEVALALALHGQEMGIQSPIDTTKLWELSQLVSELTGIPLPANKAVCGGNVFATEAGIHQDGILKHPGTYLPYRSELTGAPSVRLVIGKHSGRSAVSERLKSLNIAMEGEDLDRVMEIAKTAPKEAWVDDAALLSSAVAVVRAGL